MNKILFFLFTVLLNLEYSYACLSLPKKMKLSGSSFEKDYLSFPDTDYGVGIQQGQDMIFYHQELKQWCVIQKNQTNIKPQCLKEGTEFFITQESDGENKGKVSGIFKVFNGDLMLFSTSHDKKQDRSKPYLKFTSQPKYSNPSFQPIVNGEKFKTGFHIESISFKDGTTGVYDISGMTGQLSTDGKFISPKFRGLPNITNEDVVDISGNSIETESHCGGIVKLSTFDKSKIKMGVTQPLLNK